MSELNLNQNTNIYVRSISASSANSNSTESIVNYVNKLKKQSSSHNIIEFDLGANGLEHGAKNQSLIDKINKKIANNEYWFSLEFFPPKTINGAANLIQKYHFNL